jgi:hypothetical protein
MHLTDPQRRKKKKNELNDSIRDHASIRIRPWKEDPEKIKAFEKRNRKSEIRPHQRTTRYRSI